VCERTHIHTNTIDNSNEFVIFCVRDQLIVQMVSWFKAFLAYGIMLKVIVNG
jgi:hypothetical protein